MKQYCKTCGMETEHIDKPKQESIICLLCGLVSRNKKRFNSNERRTK